MLLIVANVGTAVVLFPILRRQNETLALGFVASRILESAAIGVGLISLLSIVTLRESYAGDSGADATVLQAIGETLVAVHERTFLLGPGFSVAIGNGLILGYLMYRSGLVPRRMAALGLIGGPLLFASSLAVLFGVYGQTDSVAFLPAIPEIAWEGSLGIYLIVKGFKQAPILAQA